MKTIKNKPQNNMLAGIPFIICMAFILIYPKDSSESVKSGCELFVGSILPTLFPFFVLSSFAVNYGLDAYLGNIFSKVLQRFFGINTGAYTYPISILSGYPTSAKVISSGYIMGNITKRDANILLILCSNGSMAFILSFIGLNLLKSTKAAYILLMANYLAPIITAKIMTYKLPPVYAPPLLSESSKRQGFISAFITSVSSSMSSVMNVGAFIIFFSVIISCVKKIIGTSIIANILCSVIELSSGCSITGRMNIPITVKLSLLGFLVGFGGICVIFQCLSFLDETDLDKAMFVKYKILCGVINSCICYALVTLTDIKNLPVSSITVNTPNSLNNINILLLGYLLFIIFISLINKKAEKKT